VRSTENSLVTSTSLEVGGKSFKICDFYKNDYHKKYNKKRNRRQMVAMVGVTNDVLGVFRGKSVKQPHVDYICYK